MDGAGGCVCLGGSQRGGDALRDAQVILSAPSCGLTFTLAQKYLHLDIYSFLPVWPQDALVAVDFSQPFITRDAGGLRAVWWN